MNRRAGLAMVAITIAAFALHFSQPLAQAPAGTIAFRIIVVESADAARGVLEQLSKGENFLALARRVSVDSSAGTGGLIGPVALSDLRPALRSALEGLSMGELSGVVTLPTGFAVLKLVSIDEAGAPAPAGGAPPADAPMGSFTSAINAAGSVKYVLDVSGYIETIVSLRQFKMPPEANLHLPTYCQVRKRLFTNAQALVEKSLASSGNASAPTAPLDLASVYFLKGQLHLFEGAMAPAIDALLKARQVAPADVSELRLQLAEALGVAHLHKAEMDNGVYHAPGERCLLGDRRRQPFAKTEDVVKAIEYFNAYLKERPDELEVRWLLNLAHMFAGTYPDRVPRAQLIPPDALASAEDVGRFTDVAAQAGLTAVSAAGGVIVDDFDNDGRLDIVTSTMDSCEPLRFFRRNEDGTFTERGAKAGLSEQLGGLNIVQTDYNNDGHIDILVLRGGWETPQRKSLLKNNGDGTFTDVTVASGLATLTGTQAAVWTDFDNDGDLDLFLGNESGPARLFRNTGDGTFDDIASKAGVDRQSVNKGVAAADYDNDGWPDLYVSNLGGANFLYRNNRDGTFSEFGVGAGAPGPGQGFPTWFFDYDNDGYQDLFVGSFVTSVDEAARPFLRMPRNGHTLKLYRNLRDGSFQDMTRQAGLDKSLMVMGANFGDIDNDGFLDIYLGTGNPSYAALVPSVLLRNKEGKAFVDVTTSSGTGELHKGHGVAFADMDHDGDEEIVFEVGGATPADAHALRLFENPGHKNDWLALKLVGVKTNRPAIGARIAVTVEGPSGRRSIHRVVGSGGSFGASPFQQHVGLGPDARNVAVEIWWPTSNTRQRFTNVGKNQLIQVTEFASDYARLQRPLLRLGSPK